MATDLLFLRDAELRSFDATVVAVDEDRVELDRTAFYATGGGQPHDVGTITWEGGEAPVVDVRKDGGTVWHRIAGGVPPVGVAVRGELDWTRRHALMRSHTAMHLLCGVIWNEWRVPATGGNMDPVVGDDLALEVGSPAVPAADDGRAVGRARLDFEFDPLPEGFGARVEALVNAEIAADRPITVDFLPRSEAVLDDSLIRTKVNLVPESVAQIRVVDIVGLDKQADGGTHVPSTGAVGGIRVLKTESKGKANKRIRFEVVDA